ncbi:unnamed protein product [Rhizophagus irregularis]|nr:unnamed protein product [Rhizophagus irregularis]
MDEALHTLTTEINRLDFTPEEQISLVQYFTHNVQKIVSFLPNFTTDGDRRVYLKSLSLLSTPTEGVEGIIEELEDLQLQTDESRKLKRKKEYMDTVKNSLEAEPPSTSAKPNRFSVDQKKNPILNGRPLDLIGPPITLYHRAFSEFLENFEDVNLEISPDIFNWITDFIFAAAEFYDTEDERLEKIRDILSKKWTIDLIEYQKKSGIGYSCDGVFMCKIKNKLTAYIAFIEGKNEVGLGGCDPSIQGAIYYRDHWSQHCAQEIRNSCCVPSLIITVAGPWFCVLGAVFLNRVVVQPLTDTIPFTVNLRNDVQVMRIARLFQALDIAFEHLTSFYQKVELSSLPSDRRFFPYIQQAGFGNNAFSFTYICEILDDHSRPIWKAMRDDNNKMIVVKFALKYNAKAHIICAEKNYAPELLYYSDEEEAKRLGGYKMIIMEYIDGISLARKFNRGEIKTKNNIYADVKESMKLLHDKNLVFADLRIPNILVDEIDGCQRAKLIDFDWCGVHNQDRYPLSMNPKISWPYGVKPYALLQKDHDITWLNELKELLENSAKSSPQSSITSASKSSQSINIPIHQKASSSHTSTLQSMLPNIPQKATSSSISSHISKPQSIFSNIPQKAPSSHTSTLQSMPPNIPQKASSSSFIPQGSATSASSWNPRVCSCGCITFRPGIFNRKECNSCGHTH